ncbi:hypothetical protein ElyMa_002624900, partial [Elysia marginata]
VSDWVSSWNLVPQSRVVPFDMLQTIEETPKDSLKPSSAATTDKIRRKLSQVAHVSKQLTMMKRRVLKKVITRRGEEIICDVTPSPTLSRQSSIDYSDVSDEEKSRRRKSGSLSISQESSKSIDSTASNSSKQTNKLLISPNENKLTPKKSPRRAAKNKPKTERISFASDEPMDHFTRNEDKKNTSKVSEETSADNFVNIVSLAMKTASDGKGLDKAKSACNQTEQISCPIKLEVTQYETESDGNCSDAKARTRSSPEESNTYNTHNATLATAKDDTKQPSEADRIKTSPVYNPRALCSKRPPSLASVHSTSSSLSSFDKLSGVEVTIASKLKTNTLGFNTTLATSVSGGKTNFTHDESLGLQENQTKFTASNIVGTFLDALSQGKRSGLTKSGSLPLSFAKQSNTSDNGSVGRSDSVAGHCIVDSGHGELDLQTLDIEGESTISQIKKLKERTESLSSQSSSSSHPTRDPSQNVSPSPSRNVSPPTRNASPSQSRNASPSPSKNASLSHSSNISSSLISNCDDSPISIEISPSHSKKITASPATNSLISPCKRNRSLSPFANQPTQTKSIVTHSPSIHVSSSRSKEGSPLPSRNASPCRSEDTTSRQFFNDSNVHEEENSVFSSKHDDLPDSKEEPTTSPTQFSLSTTETGGNEKTGQLDIQGLYMELGSLTKASSSFRSAAEDPLLLIPGSNYLDSQENQDLAKIKKNESIFSDIDEAMNTGSQIVSSGNRLTKSNSDERCEKNDNKDTFTVNCDVINDKAITKGIYRDRLGEQLPDEGIVVSSSSNSNTDEHLEQQKRRKDFKGSRYTNEEVSVEEHKKRHVIYVADKDEQDLIDGDLDFDALARRRGSASFDFSDYKPRHKITWSQHRSFSQERKLRKSLSCPSHSMGGFIASARDRLRSPKVRKREEPSPHLADCSSTSESGEEAKTRREQFKVDAGTRSPEVNVKTSSPAQDDDQSNTTIDKNTLMWQKREENDKMLRSFENDFEIAVNAIDSGHQNEKQGNEVKSLKDKRTTKYHIQLISASDVKKQDTRPATLTHTWSSSRGSGRGSFGKFRRKNRRLSSSLSVSEARHAQHPYFFSLGDDPGSDVHSDDLLSRGKTDQMLVTGSSSPSSSCASASAAAGKKSASSRTTSSARRGRLARSKKWNTFDGDSLGSHQASLSITGGNVSLDQTMIESGNSSGGGSDGPAKGDENGSSAQMRHLLNSLTRRRASEGIGLKAENHEDEEGDEEDDEVLQIVIESKVLKHSNSPRRVNDDEFGNDDDEDSVLPQSLTSGPTGDLSSLTHYESNAPTSVENSPLSHLGAPVINQSINFTNALSTFATPYEFNRLGFPVDSVSPMSGLSNRSDNSDWSDDEVVAAKAQVRSEELVRQQSSQEDKGRGDWSPRLVDFSCRSESPLSQSKLGFEAVPVITSTSDDMAVAPSGDSQNCKDKRIKLEKSSNDETSCYPEHSLTDDLESQTSRHGCNDEQKLSNRRHHRMVKTQDGGNIQNSMNKPKSPSTPEREFICSTKPKFKEASIVGASDIGFNSDSNANGCFNSSSVFKEGYVDKASRVIKTVDTSVTNSTSALPANNCPDCFLNYSIKNLYNSLTDSDINEIGLDQGHKDETCKCSGCLHHFRSPFTPFEVGQNRYKFGKRNCPQTNYRTQESNTTPSSLKLRRMPMYDSGDTQPDSDFNRPLPSSSLIDTSSKDTIVVRCASCAEENMRRKISIPEYIRPVPLNFGSQGVSPFFSNIDMFSPTMSVCAATDNWSTSSKSYTLDDSNLLLSGHQDLSDHSSSFSTCEETKLLRRVPDGCEVGAQEAGYYYFQEKTLTPTKYRKISNTFTHDVTRNQTLKNSKRGKKGKWATRLKEERPYRTGFHQSKEEIFCFKCAENIKKFPGPDNYAHDFALHPLSEPGDILLTPTKFKQERGRTSILNVDSGRTERNSQTCNAWPFYPLDSCIDKCCFCSNNPDTTRHLINPESEQLSAGPSVSQTSEQMSSSPLILQCNEIEAPQNTCPLCCVTATINVHPRNLPSSTPSLQPNRFGSQPMQEKDMVHITHFDVHRGVYRTSCYSDIIGLKEIAPRISYDDDDDRMKISNEILSEHSDFEDKTNHGKSGSGNTNDSIFHIECECEHHPPFHQTKISSGDHQHNCTGFLSLMKRLNTQCDCYAKGGHVCPKTLTHASPICQQSKTKRNQEPDKGEKQSSLPAVSKVKVKGKSELFNDLYDHQNQSSPCRKLNCEFLPRNSEKKLCYSDHSELDSDKESKSSSFKNKEQHQHQGKSDHSLYNHDYQQHGKQGQLEQQFYKQQTRPQEKLGHAEPTSQQKQNQVSQKLQNDEISKNEIGSQEKLSLSKIQIPDISTAPLLNQQKQQQQKVDENKELQLHEVSENESLKHDYQPQLHPQISDDHQNLSVTCQLHQQHPFHNLNPHHHHQQQQQQQRAQLQHQQQEFQHSNSPRNNGIRHAHLLRRESTVDTFDSGITEGSLHMVLPQASKDSQTLEESLLSLDLSRDLDNLDIDQPLRIHPL